MKNQIVLGLDPGSRTTGFAVVEFTATTRNVLICDVIKLDKIPEHQDRLKELFEHIQQLIEVYKPTTAAVETPVYGKDPLAMLKLGRAQAACMLAPKLAGLTITEYYPKSVKKASLMFCAKTLFFNVGISSRKGVLISALANKVRLPIPISEKGL